MGVYWEHTGAVKENTIRAASGGQAVALPEACPPRGSGPRETGASKAGAPGHSAFSASPEALRERLAERTGANAGAIAAVAFNACHRRNAGKTVLARVVRRHQVR